MKNLALLAMVIIGAALTSCTFTEKIYIQEDGSGSFQMDMDLSPILSFAGDMAKSIGGENTSELTKILEKMDTTFLFNDMLVEKKDSISKLPQEQRAVLESLKDAKMRLRVDEAAGVFLSNFYYDFKDMSEAKEMQNKVLTAFDIASKKQNLAGMPNNIAYDYTGDTFKRIVSTQKKTKKEQQEFDNSLEQMAMFLVGSTYNIEYHFPKAIKSTTAKDATFSQDKKVIFISYSAEEVINNEGIMNFEVKF